MVKPAKWMDLFALVFSLAVIGGSGVWMLQNGIFSAASLSTNANAVWYLIRSAGITAYLLLVLSMVWGLFISGQYVKNWSPGPLSLMMHSTVSWLALILGFTHALLLMADSYFSFKLSDILIPFTGPYRVIAVGLGTLAFWIILAVTVSFPFKRQIGHKAWLSIHMSSYIAFALVTLHGLTAGTDGSLLGFRIMLAMSVISVVALMIVRMSKDHNKATQHSSALPRHAD